MVLIVSIDTFSVKGNVTMERYGRCAAGTKGGLQASERNEPTVYSRQPTVKEQGFRIPASGVGIRK